MESKTFDSVRTAVAAGDVHVSKHARDEAVRDALSVMDVIHATARSEVIEDYPDDARGPSCLVLLRAADGRPVHAVWAFDDAARRAILVTMYRPDPDRWSEDFRQRRQKA